jgi:hypothetical protein
MLFLQTLQTSQLGVKDCAVSPAQYFNQLHSFLKEHAQMPIFNIELGAYVGVLQQ